MSLSDFFRLPALIMFFAGVFLSAWVMGAVRTLRSKVGG